MATLMNGDDVNQVQTVPTNSVTKALHEIKKAVVDTANAMLAMTNVLYQYSITNDWAEIKEQLISNSILGESTIKKLLAIAQNPALMQKNNWELLPPSYNNLHQLSQIDPTKLNSLIKKGEIYAGMTIIEASQLKEQFGGKRLKKKTAPKQSTTLQFTVKFKVDGDIKGINSKINSELKKFKSIIEQLDPEAKFFD
jgi:hypothetical protein